MILSGGQLEYFSEQNIWFEFSIFPETPLDVSSSNKACPGRVVPPRKSASLAKFWFLRNMPLSAPCCPCCPWSASGRAYIYRWPRWKCGNFFVLVKFFRFSKNSAKSVHKQWRMQCLNTFLLKKKRVIHWAEHLKMHSKMRFFQFLFIFFSISKIFQNFSKKIKFFFKNF